MGIHPLHSIPQFQQYNLCFENTAVPKDTNAVSNSNILFIYNLFRKDNSFCNDMAIY